MNWQAIVLLTLFAVRALASLATLGMSKPERTHEWGDVVGDWIYVAIMDTRTYRVVDGHGAEL